jgi:hypothetical protein
MTTEQFAQEVDTKLFDKLVDDICGERQMGFSGIYIEFAKEVLERYLTTTIVEIYDARGLSVLELKDFLRTARSGIVWITTERGEVQANSVCAFHKVGQVFDVLIKSEV